MRREKHGRIIFTTSIAGVMGLGKVHGYTASKSGLIGLTRSLASELGEYGITCNGILPGYFETDLTASYLQNDEYVARLNSRVPLRRGASHVTSPVLPFSFRRMPLPTSPDNKSWSMGVTPSVYDGVA
jgi:NAD(P)-dependent dehydrogenase (short-subunit alcohol dehydrogenase family)